MPTAVPDLSAVLDRIRGWAAANALKPATLARQAGIAEVVTRDMDDAGWSPSSRSIRRLEALIPAGWKPGDPLPPVMGECGGDAQAATAGGS